jgi:hypothetical protein
MKRMAIAVVALGSMAALTACEKPAPLVTVFSGTNSEWSRALCWSEDPNESIQAQGCAASIVAAASEGGAAPTIHVIPGDVVGISVDPVVTDGGWYPVIGTERLSSTPITSTYFRFTFPEFQPIPEEGVEMRIQAVGNGGENDLRGIWVFRLSTQR